MHLVLAGFDKLLKEWILVNENLKERAFVCAELRHSLCNDK